MPGLQLVVTDAGRAAIVNAENTGTDPVLIAQIGVTATAFTANPAGTDTALPGELKRLSTFAGAAVADDTIHVTLRDDSADVYSMRGFALYLADGTLFALYGQAGVILEKSAQAMLLLSADVRFVQVDATSLSFGDASFMNPPATTTQVGVVRMATTPEAVAGTDPLLAIAPPGLKAVLDARLGAGAPTTFVKGLLGLATAALFRASLEIKSAALKDEGTGNGLDADLLDGQHGSYYRAWSNLTGVPSTFAPSAHSHDWASITGKPTTFAPSAHTHVIADVTGLQTALNAKANLGVDVAFRDVRVTRGSDQGVLYLGDTTTRYFFYDGAGNYLFGNGVGGAWTAYHSGNFNPATKVNVTDPTSSGSFTHTCSSGSDVFVVNKPGGSPTGSYVQFSSPGGAPGIIGQYGTTKRRDIVFGTGSIGFMVSTSTALQSVQFNMLESGAFTATGGFQIGSSKFLKTALRPLPYGLAEVERIEVMSGMYHKRFNPDGRRRLFVIAEQLADVIPEAVFEDSATMGRQTFPTVEYTQLVPVLINACKELSARVRVLEGRQ